MNPGEQASQNEQSGTSAPGPTARIRRIGGPIMPDRRAPGTQNHQDEAQKRRVDTDDKARSEGRVGQLAQLTGEIVDGLPRIAAPIDQ